MSAHKPGRGLVTMLAAALMLVAGGGVALLVANRAPAPSASPAPTSASEALASATALAKPQPQVAAGRPIFRDSRSLTVPAAAPGEQSVAAAGVSVGAMVAPSPAPSSSSGGFTSGDATRAVVTPAMQFAAPPATNGTLSTLVPATAGADAIPNEPAQGPSTAGASSTATLRFAEAPAPANPQPSPIVASAPRVVLPSDTSQVLRDTTAVALAAPVEVLAEPEVSGKAEVAAKAEASVAGDAVTAAPQVRAPAHEGAAPAQAAPLVAEIPPSNRVPSPTIMDRGEFLPSTTVDLSKPTPSPSLAAGPIGTPTPDATSVVALSAPASPTPPAPAAPAEVVAPPPPSPESQSTQVGATSSQPAQDASLRQLDEAAPSSAAGDQPAPSDAEATVPVVSPVSAATDTDTANASIPAAGKPAVADALDDARPVVELAPAVQPVPEAEAVAPIEAGKPNTSEVAQAVPAASVAADPAAVDAPAQTSPTVTPPAVAPLPTEVAALAPAPSALANDPAVKPAPDVATASPTLPVPTVLRRARELLSQGDISGARLFLRRGRDMGNAESVLLLASTYDPRWLRDHGVQGLYPNAKTARELYNQALELGANDAQARLRLLEASTAR